MSNTCDIISDILVRALERIGKVSKTAAQKLEAEIGALELEIRQDYGGERHYVIRGGESSFDLRVERDLRLLADYQRGERVPLLARRYGISERRVYQIIAPVAAQLDLR